jgi:hypothetical protein
MSEDLFLRATRAHIRFPSSVGLLSTEDLWDLPLTSKRSQQASIENIGRDLLAKQASLQQGSILQSAEPSDERNRVDLAVEVLRTIARFKEDEIKAKTEEAARRAKRQELLEAIQSRELQELPLDDLRKRLADL